jgi:polar amino acid transport system substrate-binding protein
VVADHNREKDDDNRWERKFDVRSIVVVVCLVGNSDDDGRPCAQPRPDKGNRADREVARGDGISAAGGAFWSKKTESGSYSGVPVDLGREMAAQLGVPVEYVAYQNSGQITDAASKGVWDVSFLPKDKQRESKMSFGPIYEVNDATYIVRAGSSITNFATLDQPGVKVAAVNNTTTLRGAQAQLKNAKVTGYETYDEIVALLKSGEIDAFALSRDKLDKLALKIPGTRVLDETFKKTTTAVAVPLDHPQALAFVAKFMTDAASNGALRKAYDNNGLKDAPIGTQ